MLLICYGQEVTTFIVHGRLKSSTRFMHGSVCCKLMLYLPLCKIGCSQARFPTMSGALLKVEILGLFLEIMEAV